MNTKIWTDYFLANRARYVEHSFDSECTLPKQMLPALLRSLAIFQLGESGGGTRLMRYVRKVVRAEQLAGYEEAVSLFVAEEQYHAVLLSKLIEHLGGSCLQNQWTNRIFRWLRNHFGVEFNIQILLTAELIAEVYFGLLYRRVNDPAVHAVSHKLLSDEMRHIAFHTEFLRERLAVMPRWKSLMWRAQFCLIHHITLSVVAFDHRKCLRLAANTSPLQFMHMASRTGRRFFRRLGRDQKLWTASSGSFARSELQQKKIAEPQPI